MMSGHLGIPRVLEVVCHCCCLYCHWRHCQQKIFYGLASRQMLGGFLGALMVLNGGLPLTERLVLELEY